MTEPLPALEAAPTQTPFAHGEALGLPAVLLLLAISAIVLVPGMAGVSLFDRDEGWYAQVSREMVQSGNWLVPRLYGEVWLAKPPLLYWLVAGSYKLFGIGEWQTRLVPALATAINVLLVAKLGAMIFGRRVGLLAGLFFATCGVIALLGKLLLTDWVMMAFTFSAVCLHWRIAERSGQGSGFRVQQRAAGFSPRGANTSANGSPPQDGNQAVSELWDAPRAAQSAIRNPQSAIHLQSAAYWLLIALGILTKGPAILLFCGGFGVALLTVSQWRQWLWDKRWWAWSLLAVAVAAPWFIHIRWKAGPVLANQFFLYENVARVLHPPPALHPAPPGYHLLLSFAFWLPWTIFMPRTLIEAFRGWRAEPRLRLLLIWALLPWIILELIPSKLLWYVLPCYAPLAILLARTLEPCLRAGIAWSSLDRAAQREFRLWPIIMITLGLAGVVGGAVGWDRRWSFAAMGTSAVLIIGFEAVRRVQHRSASIRMTFTVGLLTAMGFYAAVGAWLLPKFEPMRLSRQVAQSIDNKAHPGDHVYLCGYNEPTAFFYLSKYPATSAKAEELPAALATARGPILLAITQGPLDSLDPSVWSRWQRQPVGRVDGRNYSRGFARETIWLERLVRTPAVPQSQPHP